MKNVLFLTLLFVSTITIDGLSQSCKKLNFSECAAIYVNDNMLVNDYSSKGKCLIQPNEKGKLHIYSIELSFDNGLPFQQVPFKVAIRNDRTNTMWMYSDETFQTADLEKILSKCSLGDSIVLLTVDNRYSLPHHEIFINWGC